MHGTPSRIGGIPRPAGLWGAIVLILVVEHVVERYECMINPSIGWLWREGGRAAAGEARDSPVLCLGDSQVKHGLLTRVLEARLGCRAANLAFPGGQATSTFFQLRRALEAGARPSAVVVDFNPILLDHGPEENAYRWAEYLSKGECLDLAWSAHDPDLAALTIACRMLPSLRVREGIRTCLPAALRGEPKAFLEEAWQVRRNLRVNRGTVVFPRNPRCYFVADLDAWFREAFHADYLVSRPNAIYLGRFLKLASSRRIPVFWIVPPHHPRIEERLDRGGINARYSALLRWALAKYPNLVVIDGRRSGYPPEVYYDQGHLDRVGASAFSDDVAAVLLQHLTGRAGTGRFEILPRYRQRPPEAPVEDLGETYAALHAPPAGTGQPEAKLSRHSPEATRR